MSKGNDCGVLVSVVAASVVMWGCGETQDGQASEMTLPGPSGTSSNSGGGVGVGGTDPTASPSAAGEGNASPVDTEASSASPPSKEPTADGLDMPAPAPSGAGGGVDDGEGSSAAGGALGEGSASGGSPGDAATDDNTGAGGAASPSAPVGSGCNSASWPAADPYTTGPFEVATDDEVGPEAGEPEEDGTVPRYTLFRPADIEQSEYCHPVITWGNGTGSTPNLYGSLLRHLASHGFVVIGSNSTNVSRGDPKPMNVGIDWVLEQNEDASSVLYQRVDPERIGATGHSQGAAATTQASGDQRIVASVPIQGGGVQRDLNGPAMFFCGGMDDVVSCDGAQRALEAITTLPAMYANYLTATHGSWLSRGGNERSDVEAAVTAWMRVHLMNDTELRSWFYGDSCRLCTDTAWEIDRKNMDQ